MSFELPLTVQEALRFVFKDGDELNWSPKNVTYWFSDGPVECPFALNFFYIPGFSRYAISKDAQVIRIRDGRRTSWYDTVPGKTSIRGGYKKCRLLADWGERLLVSRHRLLMLTFRPLDEHPGLKVVNHLNGIGGDDRLDNLEWCTHSENVQHAYDNNLYANKLRPVEILNWITGETQVCKSVVEVVRKTGLNFNTCTHRLRAENSRRYSDGWRLKEPHEKWLPLNERVGQSSCEKPVVYLNPVTGTAGWAHSVANAAEITGVAASTIAVHCRRKGGVPSLGFYFRFADEFGGWPQLDERQIAILNEYPDNPRDGIEVYDIDSNETLLFKHPKDAAEHFGLSMITVLKLARYEGVRKHRFKFRLVRINKEF